MADLIDELHILRSNFHLGSWQQVIEEASNPSYTPRSEETKVERQVYLYRAYIAQGYPERAIAEISDSHPAELRAVKCLARYVKASKAGNKLERSNVVDDITRLMGEGTNGLSSTIQALAGTILYSEEQYVDALKTVAESPRNLECVALAIQTYLKLDRADLARKEVENVKTWADDATLAQLAEGWVNCYMGGEKRIQESQYIFEELASAKQTTGTLLAAQAICKMQAGHFAEAERLLSEALVRYPNDPDVLANLIACLAATDKPTEVITSQLRQVAPQHPFLQELAVKAATLDAYAAM